MNRPLSKLQRSNKKSINFFLFILIFIPTVVFSRVIETVKISDILPEIDSNTLVIFDIDDTLITTTVSLGNTPCWSYLSKRFKNSNLMLDASESPLNPIIEKIIREVPYKTLEMDTVNVVQSLQKGGVSILGLTARKMHPFYLKDADDVTYNSLKELGIDFFKKQFDFKEQAPCFFSKGIIYTDYQLKGPFLKIFIQSIENTPSKIVFVDDQLIHINSVEEIANNFSIPFVGFHYIYGEKNYPTFDPLLLNIEFEKFVEDGLIITDSEAEKIKLDGCFSNPDYFIDSLIEKCKTSLNLFRNSL